LTIFLFLWLILDKEYYMTKKIFMGFVVFCFLAITACPKPYIRPPEPVENPNAEPGITLVIPELFSPDPDVVDDEMMIGISINHPAPIKEWQIQIQPNRGQRQAGQRQGGQGQGGQGGQRQGQGGGQAGEGGQRQGGGQGQDGQGQGGQGGGQGRRRGPFFTQTGEGKPLEEWKWNGKGTSGEMVQSATDYMFTLTVTDSFGNTSTEEGLINVDVLVKKDGDNYKMVVPSITFPPSSSDLTKVSEDEMRTNRRVLSLVGRALNKYAAYQVTVEGHSNPLTPPNTAQRTAEERSDQALSEQRARAVMNYLAADNGNNNVDSKRLKAVGMSCRQPVADYDDEEESWKNRRVEFILARG
jgi:outer membrane protein OmpA-like peptidoglycan-associated protein